MAAYSKGRTHIQILETQKARLRKIAEEEMAPKIGTMPYDWMVMEELLKLWEARREAFQ